MRHRKKINPLSRKSAHRKAMLANMATSLIIHKRINTTLAKAKVLRTYIEPLITKSKDDTTHSRRVVFSYLQSKEAVTELFRDISVKVAERPGGYTRIIKTGTRLGDSAEMCMIELVDYNPNLMETKEAAKGKASRRRRGAKKPAALPVEGKSEEKAETVADDLSSEIVQEEAIKTPEHKIEEETVVEAEKTEAGTDPESAEPTANDDEEAEKEKQPEPEAQEIKDSSEKDEGKEEEQKDEKPLKEDETK